MFYQKLLPRNIFIQCFFIFLPSVSFAQSQQTTSSDKHALECGKAQIDANKCLKESKEGVSGVFGSLASKVTTQDIGKTAADKASDQAASKLCQDKSDKAQQLCQP